MTRPPDDPEASEADCDRPDGPALVAIRWALVFYLAPVIVVVLLIGTLSLLLQSIIRSGVGQGHRPLARNPAAPKARCGRRDAAGAGLAPDRRGSRAGL